ncbi:outer membrane beta-barrel protein [Flavivirga sp. 57AJ16]|uniref:outer membrane beta-barrel protein n=1 Tax=Flavivirga sp. 57AJ16 TaxID=3025307 RepID=UPI002367268C|nr:outer membrane beta-barrel protein [Flavivirga sp. 57AJ16]MDD7888090.1 outer membrane beta-barrel protein [Flavivirga sp. 57AJ16]
MKKIFLLVTFLYTINFYAQSVSFKITGIILSDRNTPLESATIHLEKIQDSTVVSYTISDKKGSFFLEGSTFEKELNMYVSHIGFQPYFIKLALTKKEFQLGTINLKPNTNLLDEVVIKSRSPITIKKDTIEFNVKSFKTKKDATVEDLLKELPGFEVNDDGEITINGKLVNKVLLNGKTFFGDDPTIATRNLPKDIIDKVQVSDTRTKSEAFTGEKGAQENKTVNLTTNKEKNKGWFGRSVAGLGTHERNEYAAIANHFNNDKQIGALVNGNNINAPGYNFNGAQRRSVSLNNVSDFIPGGSNKGIIKSKSFGTSYADDFGKDAEMNTDYFYSGSNTENKSIRNSENILPDGKFFSNSSTSSINDKEKHTANLKFDIVIDSTFLINVAPSFTLDKGNQFSTRDQESLDENNVLINRSNSIINNKKTDKDFSNRIDLTKRFGEKGSFMRLSMSNQFNDSESDDYNISTTEILNSTTTNQNQFIDGDLNYNRLETQLTYRHFIIDKKLYLDFKYDYRKEKRESIKSTFDFDSINNQYSTFNSRLSTDFMYNNIRNKPAVALSYVGGKWNTRIESGYVFQTLENQDKLRPNLNLKRDYNALELFGFLNYKFNPNEYIYARYQLQNKPPEINQIQPYEDITNPLNIIVGNPDLKPTSTHTIAVGFNKFNIQKGTGFNTRAILNFMENQVITKSIVNDDLVNNTTFTNIDGNYNLFLVASYNKKIQIDPVRSLKLNIGTNSITIKNINFFNNEKYKSQTTSIIPRIGVTFEWKNVFKIDPMYKLSFSKTNLNLDSFEKQSFIQHSLDIKTITYAPKKLEWRNDIRYVLNPNVPVGFQKSSWLWNSSITYTMFQDKGFLTLKVYDLLNQNTNAQRIATANFILDSQSTVLQQYFMLNFSWKFGNFGRRKKTSRINKSRF